MKHGIIIFVLLASAVTAAFAQPKGEIYHNNELGNRSDTIDFDIVFYQNSTPVLRKIVLDNTGTSFLQIYKKVAPHFVIQKIPLRNTLEYQEFELSSPAIPFEISPGRKDTLIISYTPNADTAPGQYPLGERMATLELMLNVPGDEITAIAHDTLLLSVLKTKDFLASRREVLDFDSVYVGVPTAVERDWLVKNVKDKDVTISNHQFTQLVTRFNEKEFKVNAEMTLPFSFVMLSDKKIPIQFRPLEMGLDSARFSLIYSPNIDNQTDSVTVKLRGVGVKQIINIDNQTFAEPITAAAVIDTITQQIVISNSARIGDSVLLNLVIRNDGNIPFGLTSQHLEGDTAQFYILKKFSDSHDLLPKLLNNAGELDTAIIVYKPSDPGNYSVRYVLGSNIRSRIATAPDSDKLRVISIAASAAKPTLELLNAPNSTIKFDSVYLPINKVCNVNRELFTLRMENKGNAPLKINSATVRPTGVFSTSIPPAEIPSNQQRNLEITFTAPADTGDYTAELLIATNSGSMGEPSDTVRIRLIGKVVEPPVVSLSFPERTTSRAGRQITIPIQVSQSINKVRKIEVTTIYQDTLGLEFDGFNELGTASEGSQIEPTIIGNTIKLIITAPDRELIDKRTLINLFFRTYLSVLDESSLSLEAKAGNLECDEVFPLQKNNGVFALDSLCGQLYRNILNSGRGFQLHSIASNPADETAFIEYSIPFTTQASVKMYSSFGTEVSTIAEGRIEPGIYQSGIPVAGLSPGVYYCIMQSGLFRAMQTIVVAR